MKLLRKFPTESITFSEKQSLEMNVLLMQAFLPQALTDKERDVLLNYLLLKDQDNLFSLENKRIVQANSKFKTLAVLNEYNRKLRNKSVFIPKNSKWIINPILNIPKETTEFKLNVEWIIIKR